MEYEVTRKIHLRLQAHNRRFFQIGINDFTEEEERSPEFAAFAAAGIIKCVVKKEVHQKTLQYSGQRIVMGEGSVAKASGSFVPMPKSEEVAPLQEEETKEETTLLEEAPDEAPKEETKPVELVEAPALPATKPKVNVKVKR